MQIVGQLNDGREGFDYNADGLRIIVEAMLHKAGSVTSKLMTLDISHNDICPAMPCMIKVDDPHLMFKLYGRDILDKATRLKEFECVGGSRSPCRQALASLPSCAL